MSDQDSLTRWLDMAGVDDSLVSIEEHTVGPPVSGASQVRIPLAFADADREVVFIFNAAGELLSLRGSNRLVEQGKRGCVRF